jgi:hypothetical protein
MRSARSSDSSADASDAGWSSHLTNGRISAAWSRLVWIHSIHRAGRADDQHRHPVDPRIVDRHHGVHEPDVRVQHDTERLAGDLGVAMRNGDCLRFVQCEQQPRRGIAEIVDDAVVQATKARARVDREERDVQSPQQGRDQVAAVRRDRLAACCWSLLGHAAA